MKTASAYTRLMTDVIAKVYHLNIYRGEESVLNNVNFSLRQGEFVYLIGRTGSGKSSLLKAMYAELPFREGEIDVVAYNLKKIKAAQIPHFRRKIGIVFQDFQLLYDRSITENLAFVLHATGWKKSSEIKNRISEVLMQVGMGAIDDKMPHQISGGEQQRLCIARALLNEPLLLFADEPTGNLDPEVAQGIHDLFLEINKAGTTVLMATHNHELVKKYDRRILKVQAGVLTDSEKDTITL